MINGGRPKLAPNANLEPERSVLQRSALLSMRNGLPATPQGCKLDPQPPASGECRLSMLQENGGGGKSDGCLTPFNSPEVPPAQLCLYYQAYNREIGMVAVLQGYWRCNLGQHPRGLEASR